MTHSLYVKSLSLPKKVIRYGKRKDFGNGYEVDDKSYMKIDFVIDMRRSKQDFFIKMGATN